MKTIVIILIACAVAAVVAVVNSASPAGELRTSAQKTINEREAVLNLISQK